MLLDPEYAMSRSSSEQRSCGTPPPAANEPVIGDLPAGPALLAAARRVLITDLLPLLPKERQLDARLVANCMAIAEREAERGVCAAGSATRELASWYEEMRRGDAEAAHSRVGVPVAKGEDADALWRRFARDLRIGAFENSPKRAAQARAILWRMTIARVRLANPRFLAANGFA
jgi:hypothetical protein